MKQGGKVEDFKGGSLKGDHHRHSAEMNMLSGVGTSPFRLQMDEANGNLLAAINKTMGLPEKPNSLPGLQSQALRTSHSSDELLTPSSLSSDDANSPTEMNSYKRLVDKPPLIKRLTMTIEKSPEDELRPLVKDPAGDNRTPSSSSGYANDGLASQSSDSIATDSQNDEPQSKLFVRINSNSSSPVHVRIYLSILK